MNSAASNSQAHGTSLIPFSTTPSLTTKATSVSSAVSEATPAYKKTLMPVYWMKMVTRNHRTESVLCPTNTTIKLEESDDKFIKPISEAAQTSSKHKHRDYAKAGYVVMSEVDKVDNVGSDVGYNTDILQQTEGVLCDCNEKKLQISQHGDTMAKQLGELAIASTISSTGGRCVCYINRHLPPMLQEDRKWTKLILPALLRWAGSLGDLWVIPDQDLI
ncbi:hypothetical protein J3A83DRAFT_4185895 [Scleroderma citrinum]